MYNKTVTVIGAGAWGSWTAYFLQLSGYTVTLVDRWGAGNSNSGSGGETRIIRTVYGGDELYTKMAYRSFELWHKYLPFWRANIYHEVGSLWLSPEGHHYVRDAVEPVKKIGYSIEELGINDACKLYPQINFEGVHSIHYEPTCGYLEARNACSTVVSEFQKIGGTYLIDRVERISATEKIEFIVTEQNHKIVSDLYIFACGPWIMKLFPELEKYIYVSRQEVYYFQDELQRRGTQLPMWLEFLQDGEMYYGIPDHFNRGFKASYDSREISFDPELDDRVLSPHLIDKMREYLGFRFPVLKETRLAEGRVCQYENSLDGDYIMDHLPGIQNGLILGGTSGHGYKMAPAIGEIVLNYLKEGVALPDRFGLNRFINNTAKRTQFS